MGVTRGGRWLVGAAVLEAVLVAGLVFALWGGERVEVVGSEGSASAARDASGTVVGAEVGGVAVTEAGVAPGDVTGPPAEEVRAVVAERAVVFGRVSSKGKAVASVSVLVTLAGETKPIGSLRTEESGTYAVPALAPGRYGLRFVRSGLRERTEEVEVPAGVDRVRVDVALVPNWELRVLMVDADGKPLVEALAELRQTQPGMWRASPHAFATFEPPPAVLPSTENHLPEVGVGRWFGADGPPMGGGPRLPRRYSGYLALAEDVPVYVSAAARTVVLATERVEAGQEEVVLRVPLAKVLASFGTVRVQVVDGVGGGPVAGARVGLSDAQSSGQGELVDGDGRVELKMQRPGVLNLDVMARELVAGWWNVEVVPGEVVDVGVVRVVAPVKVSVRYEGVDAGVEVSCSLTGLDAPPSAALRARGVRFGGRKVATGEYAVAPGRYQLRASGGGRVAFVEFDTRRLGSEVLVVPMGVAAKLRVVPGDGVGAVGLRLKDECGRTLFERWLTGRGAFDVGLPIGVYGAEVRRLGGEVEERVVRLGEEGAELVLR